MYTTLRVTHRGIVLRSWHHERLGSGLRAGRLLDAILERGPGVYSVRLDDSDVHVAKREGSSLRDAMPVRYAVSPFAARMGRFPKLAPPSLYDGVRIAGVATLLTSEDGDTLYEACVAAILSFNGQCLECPPDEHPRTLSLAESAVRRGFAVEAAPVQRESAQPLVLVNAVAGVCTLEVPGREPMPSAVILELQRVFEESVG